MDSTLASRVSLSGSPSITTIVLILNFAGARFVLCGGGGGCRSGAVVAGGDFPAAARRRLLLIAAADAAVPNRATSPALKHQNIYAG